MHVLSSLRISPSEWTVHVQVNCDTRILKGVLRSVLSLKSNKDGRYTKMARTFPHALFGTKIGYAFDAGQRPREMGF